MIVGIILAAAMLYYLLDHRTTKGKTNDKMKKRESE